jgi:hypothetical protein
VNITLPESAFIPANGANFSASWQLNCPHVSGLAWRARLCGVAGAPACCVPHHCAPLLCTVRRLPFARCVASPQPPLTRAPTQCPAHPTMLPRVCHVCCSRHPLATPRRSPAATLPPTPPRAMALHVSGERSSVLALLVVACIECATLARCVGAQLLPLAVSPSPSCCVLPAWCTPPLAQPTGPTPSTTAGQQQPCATPARCSAPTWTRPPPWP